MSKKKFGIFYWFGYTIEPDLRFILIREAGFDSTMLWWSDEYVETDGRKELLPAVEYLQ